MGKEAGVGGESRAAAGDGVGWRRRRRRWRVWRARREEERAAAMGSSRVEIGFGGSKSEEGLNGGRRLGPGRDSGANFPRFFLVSLDRYGVASEALIWFVRKEKGSVMIHWII
jgi:hypothetical protein